LSSATTEEKGKNLKKKKKKKKKMIYRSRPLRVEVTKRGEKQSHLRHGHAKKGNGQISPRRASEGGLVPAREGKKKGSLRFCSF